MGDEGSFTVLCIFTVSNCYFYDLKNCDIKERSCREIVLLSPNSHPQTKSGEQDSGYLQDPSAGTFRCHFLTSMWPQRRKILIRSCVHKGLGCWHLSLKDISAWSFWCSSLSSMNSSLSSLPKEQQLLHWGLVLCKGNFIFCSYSLANDHF